MLRSVFAQGHLWCCTKCTVLRTVIQEPRRYGGNPQEQFRAAILQRGTIWGIETSQRQSSLLMRNLMAVGLVRSCE